MTLARATRQIDLLHVTPAAPVDPITSNAVARNVYGKVAQHVVCAALGLAAIKINGNYETCFDAEMETMPEDQFIEVKSCHRTSKVVVYDWRMEKEAHCEADAYYVILLHSIKGAKSVAAILANLKAKRPIILKASLAQVHARAMMEPLCKIKPRPGGERIGYNRKGYVEGYRNIPAKPMIEDSHHVGNITFQVYDGETITAELRTLL